MRRALLLTILVLMPVIAQADQWGPFGRRIGRKGPIDSTPLITTTSPLANGTVGLAYSVTLTCTGGTPPRVFSLASGTLPTSLTLSAAGEISGTPSAAGVFAFNVTCTDNAAQFTTKPFQITILNPSLPAIIDTSPLPSGTEGIAYIYTFTCTGGTAPRTFSLFAGTLPSGVTISSAGVLSGTPAVGSSGVYTPQIRCTDNIAQTDTKTFSFTIGTGAPQITTGGDSCGGPSETPCALASGSKNVPYADVTLASTGGTGTKTWCLVSALSGQEGISNQPADCVPGDSSGGLPPGLVFATVPTVPTIADLADAGPTTAGTFVFRVKVTDAAGLFSVKDFVIIVIDPSAPSCAGILAYDFWNCVMGFNNQGTLTTRGWKLNSTADITALRNAGDTGNVVYEFATDTYAYKQDAAKFYVFRYEVKVPGTSQLRPALGGQTSGTTVIAFDTYLPKSFTAHMRNMMYTEDVQSTKTFQITFRGCESTQTNTRCLEPNFIHDGTSYLGGIVPTFNGARGVKIEDLRQAGGLATATCDGACGFNNGQTVVIAGVNSRGTLPITGCALSGGNKTILMTVSAHGIVYPNNTFRGSLDLVGETPNQNSTKVRALTIVDANTISTVVEDTMTAACTSGTLSWFPYNEARTIATAGPGSTTFTYTVLGNPESPAVAGNKTMRAIGLETVADDQISGTDCATVDLRSYTRLPPQNQSFDDQTVDYIVKCRNWTRFYLTVSWNNGPTWGPVGPGNCTGTYEKFNWYAVDQTRPAVRLFADFAFETQLLMDDKTGNGPSADDTVTGAPNCDYVNSVVPSIDRFWFEHDSSAATSSTGGAAATTFFYNRGFVALHSTDSTKIVPHASGIQVNNGTTTFEIVTPPR